MKKVDKPLSEKRKQTLDADCRASVPPQKNFLIGKFLRQKRFGPSRKTFLHGELIFFTSPYFAVSRLSAPTTERVQNVVCGSDAS